LRRHAGLRRHSWLWPACRAPGLRTHWWWRSAWSNRWLIRADIHQAPTHPIDISHSTSQHIGQLWLSASVRLGWASDQVRISGTVCD
jgi:hypothetical protein